MKKIFFAIMTATLVGFNAQAGMEAYAGSYSGKFEGRKGTLHIAVSGNVMSASFVGANGTSDILGGACNSKIGQMVDMDLDNDGAEVDHVTFAFDPGSCPRIEGRELRVDFKHKKGVPTGANASVYAYTTYDHGYKCWPNPYPPGGSSCYPETQVNHWYATGSFKK